MKGLVIALKFLTRLPLPRLSVTDEEFAASMRWFPAAGLVIGVLLCAAAKIGTLPIGSINAKSVMKKLT